MLRLKITLAVVLTAAVLGIGLILVINDSSARADRREMLCLQRAQATALAALLVPDSRIDVDGRVVGARQLAATIQSC